MNGQEERVLVVGRGRAGSSFAVALERAGRAVELVAHDGRRAVGARPAVALLCVPDGYVGAVAAAWRAALPEGTVLAHCAGSLGLGVLGGGPAASVHPLVSLPDAERGARRLRGAWFALAASTDRAHEAAASLVAALGGRPVAVDEERRALYHATAAVASNHLVALVGQVERLAAAAGVPAEAFAELARGSLDNAVHGGAASALTGPVARADWDTVRAHLSAMADEPAVSAEDVAAYRALAVLANRLVRDEDPPTDVRGATP